MITNTVQKVLHLFFQLWTQLFLFNDTNNPSPPAVITPAESDLDEKAVVEKRVAAEKSKEIDES